jgi:hypothetical protein
VTIAFTFFFGTRNLRAQTMMTGLLALLIFSELLIIVAIDRPDRSRSNRRRSPTCLPISMPTAASDRQELGYFGRLSGTDRRGSMTARPGNRV